jgi:serine protease Do
MSGNISYLERNVVINSVGAMVLLQHDVMINHGSSGGGLFNMYGELIGITNAGEDYPGLNYAIPFTGKDGFVSVVKQLIGTATNYNYGYVTGRWNIGITVSEGVSLNQSPFVKISSVDKNSNAYVAGLKEGDIIRAVKYDDGNGKKTFEVTTTNSFSAIVYEMKEILTMGDSFDLIVYRDYEDVAITVNLVKKYIFCDTGIYPD